MAFNDYQLELGGDPFVGAKLGNLLQAVGYRDIATEVRPIHLDNRAPGERAEFLAYWTELLLSGAPGLRGGQGLGGDGRGHEARAASGSRTTRTRSSSTPSCRPGPRSSDRAPST